MRVPGTVAWLALVAGCYAPSAPAGAPCDPEMLDCPSGQTCTAQAGGYYCGTGSTPFVDAAGADSSDPFGYIHHVQPGWSVGLFQDFSAQFTYVANDFVDGTDTLDNQPYDLFTLYPPFAESLAITAGREVIELSGTGYIEHDYGQHPADTPDEPDNINGGTFAANLGGNPVVWISSGSLDAGDGTFRIDPTWTLTFDTTANNARAVMWDPTGAFEDRGSPDGYIGQQYGVIRRSNEVTFADGDTSSMHVVGDAMLVTRNPSDTDALLIAVAPTTHDETMLAEHTTIRLGEGTPPAPYVAWAIVDQRQLVGILVTGEVDLVLENTDPDVIWQIVAVPVSPHPLAGSTYLLESNRTTDVDRILKITGS